MNHNHHENSHRDENKRESTRVFDLSCSHCGTHLAFYRKDGIGILSRLETDNFVDITPTEKDLRCSACQKVLARRLPSEEEGKRVYRLYAGTVQKHVVSHDKISSRESHNNDIAGK